MKRDDDRASHHLLELLQLPDRSDAERMNWFESLLALDHGFWQHDSARDREQTLAGFTYLVALSAHETLVRKGVRRDALDTRGFSHQLLLTFFRKTRTIVNARAWFYGVAARLMKNEMRRHGLYLIARRVDDVNERTIRKVDAARSDSRARLALRLALRQAIRRLGPKQRAIMSLHYIRGLAPQDIAAKTGLSASAVRQNLSRGTRRIMASLRAGSAL